MQEEVRDLPTMLNSADAAAYLGIGRNALRNWAKCGVLPAFKLRTRKFGKNYQLRFRLADLNRVLTPFPVVRSLISPEAPELPRILISRILGLASNTVHRYLETRNLKGRRPEDIREFLLRQGAKEARKQAREMYRKKVQSLRSMLTQARGQLREVSRHGKP